MKLIILLSIFSLAAAHGDFYDLLPIEVTALVKKPSDLYNFIDCLLDKGRCNDVYEGYREIAFDAVKTACKRCTVDQKKFANTFLYILRKILPYEYHNIRHKFDPQSIYFDDLEAELHKYKLLPCL